MLVLGTVLAVERRPSFKLVRKGGFALLYEGASTRSLGPEGKETPVKF